MKSSTTATAPDGTVWHIGLRWMPRWRALARRFGGWRDSNRRSDQLTDAVDWVPDPSFWPDTDCSGSHGGGGWFDFDFDFADDLVWALAAIVMLIVAGVLFWWVVLPLLLVVLDVAIVVILLVVGVVGRVLLNRPWTLEARTDGGRRYTRHVVGWRNAKAGIADLARQVTAGTTPLLVEEASRS